MSVHATSPPSGSRPIVPAGILIALLVAAFAPVLLDLQRVWESNPQYSHGYLVPVFALGLLWLRRGALQTARLRPSLWGLPLIAIGLSLRHLGGYVHIEFFEELSLIACLPGIAVAVGGWEALRWSWPSIAFLLFMLPLPYRIETALRYPLQRIGTLASTFVMQTMGLVAVSSGTTIFVNDVPINVAEACSGLGMLTIFFALSTAVAMVSQRPLGERLVVVASALPIAIAANVARITLVGLLHAFHHNALADFVHDYLAGWLMMGLALGLLWLETLYLSRLVVEETVDPFGAALASAGGNSSRRDSEAAKSLAGTATR